MELKIYDNFQIVDIDSIKIDPKNAKEHDQKDIEEKKASILEHGFVKPIAVSEESKIISAGNGMYLAAQSLGLKKIPVIFTDHSEVKAISYGLADNRLSDEGKYNLEQFNLNIKEIADWNPEMNWKALGFEKGEIDLLLASLNTQITDGENSETSSETESELSEEDMPAKPIKLTIAQREIFEIAFKKIREMESDFKLSEGRCVELLSAEFIGAS